jgi:hypothetical protein
MTRERGASRSQTAVVQRQWDRCLPLSGAVGGVPMFRDTTARVFGRGGSCCPPARAQGVPGGWRAMVPPCPMPSPREVIGLRTLVWCVGGRVRPERGREGNKTLPYRTRSPWSVRARVHDAMGVTRGRTGSRHRVVRWQAVAAGLCPGRGRTTRVARALGTGPVSTEPCVDSEILDPDGTCMGISPGATDRMDHGIDMGCRASGDLTYYVALCPVEPRDG